MLYDRGGQDSVCVERRSGPCNRTRPAAHASFETFHSKAPETVGFRVSGGHGQVTTVNIFILIGY